MLAPNDNFYLQQAEPVKSCLFALRDLILAADQEVSETTKYGMPCFVVQKKAFCYLWTDKKSGEPYILFVEGKHLMHRSLEQGDRSRMKILRIDPVQDLPLKLISSIIEEAIGLYRNEGIKTK